MVAPHTGAWIETKSTGLDNSNVTVAPHTGAWIETFPAECPANPAWSHPTRVRGLKHALTSK